MDMDPDSLLPALLFFEFGGFGNGDLFWPREFLFSPFPDPPASDVDAVPLYFLVFSDVLSTRPLFLPESPLRGIF